MSGWRLRKLLYTLGEIKKRDRAIVYIHDPLDTWEELDVDELALRIKESGDDIDKCVHYFARQYASDHFERRHWDQIGQEFATEMIMKYQAIHQKNIDEHARCVKELESKRKE